MTQKDKNLIALREFIGSREDAKDNGSTWWFDASVTYKNLTTGNTNYANMGRLYASDNVQYGGYDVSSVELESAEDIHPAWSTNFGVWKVVNGILCIDGDGPRGKYQVTIG